MWRNESAVSFCAEPEVCLLIVYVDLYSLVTTRVSGRKTIAYYFNICRIFHSSLVPDIQYYLYCLLSDETFFLADWYQQEIIGKLG